MPYDENDKGIAMEVRKFKIGPEDEARLRELLKVHEADIDRLSDEELDAAEEQTSQRLKRLLQKQSNPNQNKSLLRFRLPLKTGTMAFLAAAAVMLFMQMEVNENIPNASQVVSKGTSPVSDVSCESSIVESDGATPDYDNGHYVIHKDKNSYLKLHCSQTVYVHVGYVQGEILHLELSNLEISTAEKLVMNGHQRLDFTALAQQKSDLMVLVTEQPLEKLDLTPADRAGLWFEEIPLVIQR